MDPEGESYLRQEGRGLVHRLLRAGHATSGASTARRRISATNCSSDKLDRISDAVEFAYQALPGAGAGRDQAGHQRPLHLRARRQPAGRPGAGAEELLDRLRRHGGLQPGRWRGVDLAQWMVEGEPERDVFAVDVARFGDWITPGYTRAKVRENYQRRFSVELPERGTAGGAAVPDHARLWHLEGSARGVRRRLRHGGGQLLRAGGRAALRDPLVPPLERLRGHRRGMPGGARGGRHQRDPQFRQVPGRPAPGRTPGSTGSWPGGCRGPAGSA